MKVIDGSRGEGGGQIVRTVMGLAIITGTPVRIENIRAKREKPGLMRQHLKSVQAAAQVCEGELRGATLQTSELEFVPGRLRGGDYEFVVETAGSVGLVLQTVIPPFIAAGCAARIAVEGGSHARMAPPYDFLQHAYGRAVREMGFRFALHFERYGFYPEGGARLVAEIEPADTSRTTAEGPDQTSKPLTTAPVARRIEFDGGTSSRSLHVTSILSGVPDAIAQRQHDTLRADLEDLGLEMMFETRHVASRSSGHVLHVRLDGIPVTEVFTAFSERGRPAEQLAAALGAEVRAFVETGAPVGPHLADQLLVLLSVGAGGVFRTSALTLHSRTMLELIPEFLDVDFDVRDADDGTMLVEVAKTWV